MKIISKGMSLRYVSLLMILFFVLATPVSAADPEPDKNTVGTAEKLLSFAGGLAGVSVGGYWGFINTAGQVVIKFIFKEVGSFYVNYAPARVDTKWGYINRKGLFVINPRYDYARPFCNGLAPVKKGNLWGLINAKGRIVHDYSFEDLKGFHYGLAPAKRVGKWGFVNKKGKFVLNRVWLDAGEFQEGLAPVKDLENHWGYIDTKGEIYIESQFDDAGEFSEGLAPVKVDTKWGFVNWKGKYRINPHYEQAKQFSEKLAAVKSNGKWGYVDPKDNDIIPCIFDEAGDFSGGRALVEKDGVAFYIDTEGAKALDVTMKTGQPQVSAVPTAPLAAIPAPASEIGVKASALDFEIHYVSAANSMGTAGAKHKDDAVYLIRISGAGLNQDQLFNKGLNGFKYEIDLAGNTKTERYRVNAYPLNGVKYSDDANKNAALNPNDIAFYWIGPKPDGTSKSVKVTQLARDFNSGKDVVLAGPVEKTLPAAKPAPAKLDEYDISFSTAEGATYFNGVCAFPIRIGLSDKEGIDAPDEVYDRLVFYSEEGGALIRDKIIGADPADENKVALMPLEWGNRTKTAQPRYEISKQFLQGSMKFRTYYIFGKSTEKESRRIHVNLLQENGETASFNNFVLNALQQTEVKNSCLPENKYINTDQERTLSLEGDPLLSDPSKGDFDFVFEKASSPDDYFILPLLPEGLNERNISERFNFSTFRSGFYLRPVDSGGKVKQFKVFDRTSSLYYTWGRHIFALIFDIYGRYDRASLFTDDKMKIIKRRSGEGKEESLLIEWCPIHESQLCALVKEAGVQENKIGRRFLIGLENRTQAPVIFKTWGKTESSQYDYKKKNYTPTEIIVAPRTHDSRGKRIFYATGDDQIFWKGDEVFWEIAGYSLLSTDERFHNKFQAKKEGGGKSRLQIRSERSYRNGDSQRPYGTDGSFEFFATKNPNDRYARSWEVSCNEWGNIHSGYWKHEGDWEYGTVYGGDFTGGLVKAKGKDWFEKDYPW